MANKVEYSCKRKKDFITTTAILMFLLICIFELYLIVVLPIQLQRQNAMAFQVKKQEMLMMTELLRYRTRMAKPKNQLQECEVQLVVSSLDSVVRFIRRNVETITIEQVDEATAILRRLEKLTAPWEKGEYHFAAHDFDTQPILKSIEAKFDQAESQAR